MVNLLKLLSIGLIPFSKKSVGILGEVDQEPNSDSPILHLKII